MKDLRAWMLLMAVAGALAGGVAQAQAAKRAPAQTKTVNRADEELAQQFADSVNVALVVGVSKYPKSSGLTPLQYAANDADGVALDLRRRGYLVETLTDTEAMHQAVYSKISQLSRRLTKDQGTFVFFFSGHGFSQNDKAYLATFDTNRSDLTQGALAVKEVADALKKSGAMRQMMFLDACRDNAVLVEPGKAVAPPLPPLLAENDGLAVLWSTKAEAYSYEDPASKHGIYTNYLMKALEGGAAKNGIITFRGVSDYVTRNVWDEARTKQLFQRPYVAGEASGDFIVIDPKITINVAITVPPPPPPPPPPLPAIRRVWRGSDGRVYDVSVSPGKVEVYFNHQIVASADKADKGDKGGKLTGTATALVTPCPDMKEGGFGVYHAVPTFKVDHVTETRVDAMVAKGIDNGGRYVCQGLGKPEYTNFTLLLENAPQ